MIPWIPRLYRDAPLFVLAFLSAGCANFALPGRSKPPIDNLAAKIIPVLVASLQSEKPDTRLKSVEALEAMGATAGPAAPDLIFLLDDPVLKVREAAAATLVFIGAGAVDSLVAALEDKRYPALRKEVFPVLARMGKVAQPAVPALQAAADEQDPQIRALAMAALNVIGRSGGKSRKTKRKKNSRKSKTEGEILLASAEAPTPASAQVVVPPPPEPKFTGPIAVAELVNALRNSDPEYRTQAVAALALKEKHIGEVLPVLIHVALNDMDASVRLAAAKKLRKMGPQPASALILALSHADPGVRSHAAEVFGVIGPVTEAVLPALINTLGDPDARPSAVNALAGIGRKSIPHLLDAFHHEALYDAAGEVFVRMGKTGSPALSKALNNPAVRDRISDTLVSIGGPAVPALIWSLKANDFAPRASVLGRIGRPAVGKLVKALRSDNDKIRQGAGLTLCEMGPAAADALPAFFPLLKKHRDEVELYPLYRFGRAGVPSLIEAASDKEAHIRRLALETLARIDPVPEESFPSFIDALYDKDSGIADLAVVVLKSLGGKIIPALIEGLGGTDQRMGRASAEALGFIGPPAKKALHPLRTALLRNTDSGVRKRSAYALGELGSGAKSAVRDLISALDDDPVRWWASEALKKIGAAAPVLAKILKDDQNPQRFRAALLLNTLEPGNERVLGILTGALSSEDSGIRYQAALALGENPGLVGRSVPVLLLALKDADSGVRYGAARSLGKLGAESTRPLLLAAVESGSPLAKGALDALTMLDADAVPALVSALRDKKTRSLASNILVEMGPKSVPPLIDSLSAKGPRSPVGRILVRIGNACVPALIHALKEGRDAVREGAALTLKKIGTKEALAAL